MDKNGEMLHCDDAAIFDVLEEGVFIADANTYELLYVNDKLSKNFGVPKKDDYEGMHCYEMLHHRNKQCYDCKANLLNENRTSISWRSYNSFTKQSFRVKDRLLYYKGRLARFETLVDITKQLKQRDELQAALALEMALSEAIKLLYSQPDFERGIMEMFAYIGEYLEAERVFLYEKSGYEYRRRFEWNNDGFSAEGESGKVSVFSPDSDLWKDTLGKFQPLIINDVREFREKYPEDTRRLLERGVYSTVAMSIQLNGETVGFFGMDNLLENRAQNLPALMKTLSYFISALMNSERSKELLEMLSYTDAMTGVENRNAYIRGINQLERSKKSVGIIVFDLNGLKKVNDEYGHTAGDKMIIKLAQEIGRIFRKKEIFRTGGDEFVVLCPSVSEMRFKKRVDNIKAIFDGDKGLNVAVGSCWCNSGNELKGAIAVADGAMYEEKRKYYLEGK